MIDRQPESNPVLRLAKGCRLRVQNPQFGRAQGWMRKSVGWQEARATKQRPRSRYQSFATSAQSKTCSQCIAGTVL